MQPNQDIVEPEHSTEDKSESRSMPAGTILSVRDLVTEFMTEDGIARAVDGVSYDLQAGETLAIVGESGSGKSVTSLSILQLISDPPGRIMGGQVLFEGRDLLSLSQREIQRVRGKDIAMIFQEPMTSLNPVLTIGRQMTEGLIEHLKMKKEDAWRKAIEALDLVRLPESAKRMRQYPHQLSGGMRQRVMIAMAMACDPKVLICDEPTTALDVTIQAQILHLMADLQKRKGTSIVLITHDMGVVAEVADRVIVMYAGRKVEEGPVNEIFARPRHPYTAGLLGALPRLDALRGGQKRERLTEIPGVVPALTNLPSGCRFHDRCGYAQPHCGEQYPDLRERAPGHWTACWEADRLEEEHDG